MNLFKNIKNISIAIFLSGNMQAQDMLILDGGSIVTQNNANIIVQGNIINNNGGTIDNSGSIYFTGDWINNGGNSFLINNKKGWVELNGNIQEIGGADPTQFSNLKLSGLSPSTKTLDVTTYVSNHLSLEYNELETQSNILNITNPNTKAISWNGGFVSSSYLGGYLVRATNTDSTYIFPVGNNTLKNTYRAVKIRPNNSDSNFYGVRLAALNPGSDNSGVSASGAIGPFSEYYLGEKVEDINTSFYHNIFHFSGKSSCDIFVDYFKEDGEFTSVAQWNEVNQEWRDSEFSYLLSNSGSILNSPTYSMYKLNVSNFEEDAFALEKLKILVPGGLSPNNDGENDLFSIKGLELYPNNELTIFNRWGGIVYHASPYTNDWNGQSNGKLTLTGTEVVDGTYFYMLKLDDKITPLTGSVELKR